MEKLVVTALLSISLVSSISLAQSVCTGDYPGGITDQSKLANKLVDVVSKHLAWQRNSRITAEVLFHDVGKNKSAAYTRVADHGHVTLDPISAAEKPTMAMDVFLKMDRTGTPENRRLTEYNEDNYAFQFVGPDPTHQGWFKYNLTLKHPPAAPGQFKAGGVVWLDPQTCGLKAAQGQVESGHDDLLPYLYAVSRFQTINGVYVLQQMTTSFSGPKLAGIGSLLQKMSKETQMEMTAAVVPDGVVPPSEPMETATAVTPPTPKRTNKEH